MYPPGASGRYTSDVTETWVDPKTKQEYALSGAMLYLSHYVMHRHPNFWKDPDSFRPERFLDGSNVTRHFTPFSKGPRDCFGKYFSLLEATQSIAKLCMQYDFDCVHKDEQMCYKVTSQPAKGAMMKFRPRLVPS